MRAEVARGTLLDSGPSERGIALIAALMVMLLMSALMIGFTIIVMSDQRYRGIDKDRMRAYYGAQSGLEKLSVDLGNLFLINVAPTNAQIAALANTPPVIPSVTFVAPAGVTAYGATLVPCDNLGNTTCNATIQGGPYQGLMALKKSYSLDVVAKTTAGGEAHLIRKVESVAIPVFQFGMFSDVDLSFFAGPDFNFGGRVHTNGNLFLSEGDGSTLTLTDKVTAVKEIVRQRLQNGVSITSGTTHNGTVNMATSPNSFRPLLASEGSVQDGLTPASPNKFWLTISQNYYNFYIRNGTTGAKALNLPLITIGGTNTDLVRRPAGNEDVNDPVLFGERMFGKVSLRILLSDTAADITNLPMLTATAPVQLDGNWKVAPPNNGTAYGPVDATYPPIARSPGLQTVATTANTNAGDTTIKLTVPGGGLAGVYNSPAALSSFQIQTPGSPPANLVQIDCQSITATQFRTCRNHTANTALPDVPASGTIIVTAGGNTYTVVTSGASAQAWGNTRDFTVTSAGGTAAFATNAFWMQSSADQSWSVVTCTGVNSNAVYGGAVVQWQNCNGVPATNAGASVITTNALVQQNTGTVGGFLKVEMQDTTGVWRDVTMEMLNWGFGAPNQFGTACGDPTPNAIIRIQRLKDNNGACNYAGSTYSYDYWPNTLYDTREALQRDIAPLKADAKTADNTVIYLGGVMHYVSLDVANLSKWFKGAAPYGGGSGLNAYSNNGYGVYFSDRRNNRNAANQETGEYGFEDVVNPLSAAGTPNGTLDAGEDVNANSVLDVYGKSPSWGGVWNTLPPGGLSPFNAVASVTPTALITTPQAMTSPAVLFRRALKLVNGSLGNIVTPGLAVVTENPVYIQGDWNANQAGFGDPHAETSVTADAVTLLSNNWTDQNSFVNAHCPAVSNSTPICPTGRVRATPAWYRVAIIGGKGIAFAQPSGTATDFGTDGGAHNFLRYLESGQAVNYRGAIATFYYNRQAVGTYKCCATVYGAPTRNYAFDTDFLDPALLPPLTPVFRDLNALGFWQETRPGK